MPVVVQYRTKPDRADENRRLVEKVFAELAERGPAGFRYISLRLADGNSFVHIVVEEPAEDAASLGDMPAFKEFVAGIADRCAEQPVASGATVVGSYRFLADLTP